MKLLIQKNWMKPLAILWVAALLAGCMAAPVGSEDPALQWQWLFDGSSLDQWVGLGQADFPAEQWQIEGDTLHKLNSSADTERGYGGDLRSREQFQNFELCFEFKLTQGANSGVKYNVSERLSAQHGHPSAAIGFEFQVLDDANHPDAKAGRNGNRTVGGLYDIYPPAANKPPVAPGEWHQGCVLAETNRIRHVLDGETVLDYRPGSADFADRVAASKFAEIKGFAQRRAGYIVLQDHFDELWYRKIKIRRLD